MTRALFAALWLLQQAVVGAGTGSLTVRVVEQGTETPLSGVRILARFHGSSDPWHAIETGADGAAVFHELRAGSYEVRAESSTHLIADSNATFRGSFAPPPPPPPATDSVVMHLPGVASVPIAANERQNITFRLEPGGVISGVITARGGAVRGAVIELRSKLARSVRGHPVTRRTSQTTSDESGVFAFKGVRPGDYLLMVTPRGGERFRRNPVYYPGTVDADKAMGLTVTPGSVHSLLLEFEIVRTVPVSGRVVDAAGAGRRTVIFRRLDQETGDVINNMAARLERDGTFVSPWTVSGIHGVRYTREGSDGRVLAAATAVVRVGRDAIDGIELRAVDAASFSGQFEFADPARIPDRKPLLYLRPEGEDQWLRESLATDGQMQEDGSFTVQSIFGRNRIAVNEPYGWIVEAILLPDGRDLLEKPFEFEPGRHYAGMRVVMSDRVATIRVTLARNEQTALPTVVALPEDESLWTDYRHVRSASRTDDGGLQITGLRPGRAYLVAACDWPCSVGFDLETTRTLARRAQRIYVDQPGIFDVTLERR